MSSLQSPSSTPSKIFITGATGFIGAHVASAALRAGHRVRLSIRRAEQRERLESVLAPYLERVEFAVVPDLADVGLVQRALVSSDGVDSIWHIASPMPTPGGDVRRHYVEPAVRSTVAVLEAAALANGTSTGRRRIKSVLIMSSVVALKPMGSFGNDQTVTANTGAVLPVDLDAAFPAGPAGEMAKYHASKILAHQAYRDWVVRNKPSFLTLSFHPVFVIGRDLLLLQKSSTAAQELTGVNALFWQSLTSETAVVYSSFVDVADVALAFARAFDAVTTTPVSASEGEEGEKKVKVKVKSGTEYLLAAPKTTWRDIAAFVRERYPAVDVKLTPQGMDKPAGDVDTRPAERELDLRWTPMEEYVGAVVEQKLALKRE
ncbi:NAD(P)-binding protein [Xylariaceae sp. FL0594]|nr:NAD(P)-binding protein [Xylariaceae sp. FL0594]